MAVYGYGRISTGKQNIDRQVRNIRKLFPSAVLVLETYTGSKTLDRKKWQYLMRTVQPGDTIVFDSVSRMSRSPEEGFEDYQKLYAMDINLVFLKERHIDTCVYKKALNNTVSLTGTKADIILKAVNEYLMELAKEQIYLAFQQAGKELEDLHQRTKEGIETARLKGKQIGRRAGTKVVTKKSVVAKQDIIKHSKDFQGTLNDKDCIRLTGISKNTFYKYKRELYDQMSTEKG